jgi:hypothetical protein
VQRAPWKIRPVEDHLPLGQPLEYPDAVRGIANTRRPRRVRNAGATFANLGLFETEILSQTQPTGSRRSHPGSATVIASRSLKLGCRAVVVAAAPPPTRHATAVTAEQRRANRPTYLISASFSSGKPKKQTPDRRRGTFANTGPRQPRSPQETALEAGFRLVSSRRTSRSPIWRRVCNGCAPRLGDRVSCRDSRRRQRVSCG